MRFHTKFGLGLLSLLLAAPAWGGVLYTNGPINGNVNAWAVSQGWVITDSFVLSSDSIVTGVSQMGLWSYRDTPTTIDWVISTAPYGGGTVEGSGNGVPLTTTFLGTSPFSLFVYEAGFLIDNLRLSGGTYYLQLSSNDPFWFFWDENDGPSSAFAQWDGDRLGNLSGSHSFQIDGDMAAAPEPTGLATLGAGIVALAALRRYRHSR